MVIYVFVIIISKTFFWIANLYDEYQDGVCKPYYYNKPAKKRVEFVRKFAEIINNVDCD